MTLWAVLVLAGGTYGMRLAGPLLHNRISISANTQWWLALAATVLLFSLTAVWALTEGHHFAGWARIAGVVAGTLLALRKQQFVVVVLAAALTTALLRLAGVS